MPFFENLYRLLIWGISFGTLAYALWRWGKAGFIGLPGADVIGEFLRMLWEMMRERPLLLIVVPIITLLVGVSYLVK